MRALIVLLPAIAFSAPIPANTIQTNSIQNELAIREECSAYSGAGMRDCVGKKFGASETALRQAQSDALAALSKWDEDSKYIGLATKKLEAANAAFTRYRDAQCAFSASLGGGAIGNALETGRLACASELNNQRARQLKSAVADLPLR